MSFGLMLGLVGVWYIVDICFTELYRSRRFMPWVFNAQIFRIGDQLAHLARKITTIEELSPKHWRSISEATGGSEKVRRLRL